MPIRGGYADHVLIVTSGEMMALYAASNIASAVHNFGKRGYAKLSGIILNSRNVEDEEEIVKKAAQEMGEEVICIIPRDCAVQQAESQGMTVIEALPESTMAEAYRKLADKVLEVSGSDLLLCERKCV